MKDQWSRADPGDLALATIVNQSFFSRFLLPLAGVLRSKGSPTLRIGNSKRPSATAARTRQIGTESGESSAHTLQTSLRSEEDNQKSPEQVLDI
jgi:hypothetical protein